MIWINLVRSLGRNSWPVAEVGWQRLMKAALLFVSRPAGDFRRALNRVRAAGFWPVLPAGPGNADEVPRIIKILFQLAVEGARHGGADAAR